MTRGLTAEQIARGRELSTTSALCHTDAFRLVRQFSEEEIVLMQKFQPLLGWGLAEEFVRHVR